MANRDLSQVLASLDPEVRAAVEEGVFETLEGFGYIPTRPREEQLEFEFMNDRYMDGESTAGDPRF